jgi:hypothetical protein
MARVSLQVKNIGSLILATAASTAWSVAAKRFFDTPRKPAGAFALAGAILLLFQLALIFVESKEEEELSLVRRQRMATLQQSIEEDRKLSNRIQLEMDFGDLQTLKDWTEYRRSDRGK